MRDCQVCGTPESVTAKKGPATCPACKREKYLIVKRRYQQSEKGKATARAREEREDVREKRRQFSRSEQGKRNQAKYEATDKGRTTRAKVAKKHRNSEQGKRTAAEKHQRTKHLPERIAQKKKAHARYSQTEKYAAKKHRDYARRKRAIVPTRPVTAEDWLEILQQHKHRCHYCREPFTEESPATIDHVIPLSKSGLHVKENLVPACRSCNSTKKDKIIRLC
jgi:5-methylcytosine-specific restriction endonuclease McrA